jgi:hypothetical protein
LKHACQTPVLAVESKHRPFGHRPGKRSAWSGWAGVCHARVVGRGHHGSRIGRGWSSNQVKMFPRGWGLRHHHNSVRCSSDVTEFAAIPRILCAAVRKPLWGYLAITCHPICRAGFQRIGLCRRPAGKSIGLQGRTSGGGLRLDGVLCRRQRWLCLGPFRSGVEFYLPGTGCMSVQCSCSTQCF